MNAQTTARSTTHLWIAGAALAWNLIGLLMFVLQVGMTADQVAALPPDQRAVQDATPAWVMAAFGVAVVTGVFGAIGLLLRRRWAVATFAVSLVALLVQLGGTYVVTPAWQVSGAGGLVLPLLLVAIALFLLTHARRVLP